MGVDSQAAGNYAGCYSIEHDGKTYPLRLIDQAGKAEWERRLFDRAVTVAEAISRAKPANWLDAKLGQLENEFFAGEFALLAEKSLNLLKTPGGVQLLLSIITGKDVSELAAVILAKKGEVIRKLNLVIRESFPGVQLAAEPVEGDDPN